MYFTTDGTNPREPGGGVSADAREGPNVLTLERSTTIKARIVSGGEWGPLSEGRFQVGQAVLPGALIVSEIMYHPRVDSDPEFLELANVSDETINLLGASFSDGIVRAFTEDTLLQAGEHVILTNNRAGFRERYGDSARVVGEFLEDTRLSNGGETITLLNAEGDVVVSVA